MRNNNIFSYIGFTFLWLSFAHGSSFIVEGLSNFFEVAVSETFVFGVQLFFIALVFSNIFKIMKVLIS